MEDDIVVFCVWYKLVVIIVCYGKINVCIMDVVVGNLQVIFKYGSGIDVIDQDVVVVCGIVVCVVVGVNVVVVVEYVWVLILVCVKFVLYFDVCMYVGYWDKVMYKLVELDGCMFGLVGLGVIGCWVVVIGLVFGMYVVVFDLYVKEVFVGVKLVSLGELYVQFDVVLLYCLLMVENCKMLNCDVFSCFKFGVILVNMVCGGFIDELVLVEVLVSGWFCVVGLDSFDVELMMVLYLFQGVVNIILLLYIGGVSDVVYVNMGKGVVVNVFEVIEECVCMVV